MLFELFSQQPLFSNTRHFVYSSVSLLKAECSLQFVKHISNIGKNFPFEAVLEQGIRTFHVLKVETKCIQFM